MATAESARRLVADHPWLSARVALGHGANRVVVEDPDHAGCCLKVPLPPEARTRGGLRARLRRRLAARFPGLSENATELRAWRRLRARIDETRLAERIAPVHGLVRTPAGTALRCSLVRDDRGDPAPSLYALLSGVPRWPADALCAAVDDLEAWLLAHRVPLFDLNAGNFVVVGDRGRPRLVCVDAKSTVSGRALLPLARWFPALGRRKLVRRAARLRARIRAAGA
ncbi:hypothetical protein GCM10028862_13500 [Luteimonas pelagia]